MYKGYTINGKAAPGVTTIVRAASSKEGLIQWSANEAVKFVEKHLKKIKHIDDLKEFGSVLDEAKTAWKTIRDKAGDKGTNVHLTIADYVDDCIESKEVFELTETSRISAFSKWAIQNKVQFLKSEVRLTSETHWFGGKFDLLFEMDGKIWLGDIKTSKSVYPDNYAQLGGYNILCKENGLEVDHRCILHLTNELEVHPSYDTKRDEEYFISCLNIYKTLLTF